MKIALFSSTIDVRNGYGNITYEYCLELSKRGIRFTLFLPVSEAEMLKKLDIRTFNFDIQFILPKYLFRIKPWNFLSYLKIINVSSFDLVHSLFDFPYCFMAARSAVKYNIPFLMGAQGTYGVAPLTYWPEKYLLDWSYRQAKKIIVPSQFTKDKILHYALSVYPVDIIHNGVNFGRFTKNVYIDELRQKYKNKKILITVGGLRTRKGQDMVIKALVKLKKKFPNIIYLMVGEGYWRDYLENLAKQIGVLDMVEFVGNKKDDELIGYFKLCDIFILTPKVVSDIVFEGFGIVYLEASACHKPIIATDAGGVRDAVVENETGIIAANGDVDGIAKAIERLLSDNQLYNYLSNNGFVYAKEHDWHIIVDSFVKLYDIYVEFNKSGGRGTSKETGNIGNID